MDRYIFVFKEGEQSLNPIFCWVKNLLQGSDNSRRDEAEGKRLLRWLPVTHNFSQVCGSSSNCEWIELDSFSQHIEAKTSQGQNDVPHQTLEACLHDTADSLPSAGCRVQMYLFLHPNDLDADDTDSFCLLAGAVMRLVKWHHVRVVMVKMESELSPLGHQLVELTNGEAVSVEEGPGTATVSWCGEVSVRDEVVGDGTVFPGFYISCPKWANVLRRRHSPVEREKPTRRMRSHKDLVEPVPCPHQALTVCGSHTIEVLQEVDLRTFPLCLLTPWSFDLDSFHDKNQGHDLLDYLHRKSCTGLVARMRVYQITGDVPQCSDTSHMSTSAWRDYVMDGCPDSRMGGIPATYEYLHCLIVPNPSVRHAFHTSSPSSLKTGHLRIRVLLTAKEMTRNILSFVKRNEASQNPTGRTRRPSDCMSTKSTRRGHGDTGSGGQEWVTSLPVFKVEEFLSMVQLVSQHKQEVESGPDAQGQSTSLDSAFRDMLADGHSKLGDHLEHSEDPKEWKSEVVNGLEECPEWLALTSEVPRGHDAKKGNSCITSGPPSDTARVISKQKSFEKSGPKEFSLDDVISLFKEDNSHRSQMRLDPSPFRRLSSESDGSVDSWRQHDMYHYYTQADYDSENKYATFRDQGDFQDTRSSFLTPKKKANKQFRAILPTRSSPRTKLFNRNLSSSHSPPDQTNPNNKSTTFKHPQSFHGSSSSIQRKRPHSSLTPDLPHPSLTSDLPHPSQSSKHRSGNMTSGNHTRKHLASSSTPGTDQPGSSHRRRLTPELDLSQSSHGSSSSFPRKRPASSSFTPDNDCHRPFKFSRTSTPSPSQITPSSTSTSRLNFDPSCETSPNLNRSSSSHKRVPFTTVLDMPESGVRRSPRKLPGPQSVFAKSLKPSKLTDELSQRSEAANRKPEPSNRRQETESTHKDSSQKMKRSERHMMRLKSIISKVLTEKGVQRDDPIYQACSKNLLNVSIVLLKSLPNSRNLTDEMKSVVYGQVQQIINLEKRRSGIAL